MEIYLFTLTEAKITNLRCWGYYLMGAIPLGNTFSLKAHMVFLLLLYMEGVSKRTFWYLFL